jgi:hypothetical protein
MFLHLTHVEEYLPDGLIASLVSLEFYHQKRGCFLWTARISIGPTSSETDCRRREFLDFMNEIVAAYPDRELHVVLDNLNTHKPKQDQWLKRHPKVNLHFTPTYSSWLNQMECWFSILGQVRYLPLR